MTHGLLVGAGPDGPDNRCMLDAIAASGGRFKGIALVTSIFPSASSARSPEQGVVGIRINLMNHGMRLLTEPGADRLLARVKEMNWFVQIHCQKDELAGSGADPDKAGVRIMVDHFGRPDVKRGITQLGFETLLEFGRSGNAVVKFSCPFRSSVEGYPDPTSTLSSPLRSGVHAQRTASWVPTGRFVRMDERTGLRPSEVVLTALVARSERPAGGSLQRIRSGSSDSKKCHRR